MKQHELSRFFLNKKLSLLLCLRTLALERFVFKRENRQVKVSQFFITGEIQLFNRGLRILLKGKPEKSRTMNAHTNMNILHFQPSPCCHWKQL